MKAVRNKHNRKITQSKKSYNRTKSELIPLDRIEAIVEAFETTDPYEQAYIEACELCGPNDNEFDGLLESIEERILKEK